MAPKGLLCGKRSKVWSWVQIGYVRPTSDGSDSLQNYQKYDIMRVLSVSTSTRFVTKWVNLDFCEGYMKDKKIFFENFERKIWPIFGSIFKNLHGPKIELFPLRRVYEGKNHVTRARLLRWNGRFSVVSSKPTSTRDMIFGPSILAQMVWNAYQAFLKSFLKIKF